MASLSVYDDTSSSWAREYAKDIEARFVEESEGVPSKIVEIARKRDISPRELHLRYLDIFKSGKYSEETQHEAWAAAIGWGPYILPDKERCTHTISAGRRCRRERRCPVCGGCSHHGCKEDCSFLASRRAAVRNEREERKRNARLSYYRQFLGKSEICGFIYFIQSGSRNVFKVGWTSKRIESRLSQLQVASPDELCVVAMCRGTEEDEYRMHAALSKYRLRGEWFSISQEKMFSRIQEWIDGLFEEWLPTQIEE